MDVLVADWSDWATLKGCEVRPSLLSSARVGQPAGLMRGMHVGPATAVSVFGPLREEEPEPEAAPVD
jgi:hypothetical protein